MDTYSHHMKIQIDYLKKQNDNMEKSFKSKCINFTKLSIDEVTPETELKMLTDYNDYLKNIARTKRSLPPVKENKPTPKSKEKVEDEDEDSVEDIRKETKPVYSIITNMEEIKRAFFSNDYDRAFELIKQHPFKFYNVHYKYSDDNTGRPSYVAKNLLRGFVQGLDDYRKYLMVCFRCFLLDNVTKQYIYSSSWIVNTNDDLKTVLGTIYDDYDFVEIKGDEEIINMLKQMVKTEDENAETTLIGEVYLH